MMIEFMPLHFYEISYQILLLQLRAEELKETISPTLYSVISTIRCIREKIELVN